MAQILVYNIRMVIVSFIWLHYVAQIMVDNMQCKDGSMMTKDNGKKNDDED